MAMAEVFSSIEFQFSKFACMSISHRLAGISNAKWWLKYYRIKLINELVSQIEQMKKPIIWQENMIRGQWNLIGYCIFSCLHIAKGSLLFTADNFATLKVFWFANLPMFDVIFNLIKFFSHLWFSILASIYLFLIHMYKIKIRICLHCGLTYSKEGGVVGPKVNDKLCHSTHLAKDFVHLFPISPIQSQII